MVEVFTNAYPAVENISETKKIDFCLWVLGGKGITISKLESVMDKK